LKIVIYQRPVMFLKFLSAYKNFYHGGASA